MIVLAIFAVSISVSWPIPKNCLRAGSSGYLLSRDDLFAEVRSQIVAMVESGEIPSFVVVAARGEEILWREAFGWTDIEKQIAATPDTIYCVGSMSKSMTATAMMFLVERGLVDLDAPVDRYIAPSKLKVKQGRPEDVTIRRLMNGSAGIPHGWFSYHEEDKPSFLELPEYIKRYGYVVFKPGEEFLYSNHAFGIAACVIAKVSSRPFDTFLRTELFGPLGMEHSGEFLDENQKKHLASRYYTMDRKIALETMIGPAGGAGLFSSANDLLSYGRFQLSIKPTGAPHLLSDESLDLLHYYHNPKIPQGFLALGWGSLALGENLRLLISNGEVNGANATLILQPEKELVIVCMSNIAKQPSVSDRFAFAILDVLLPGALKKFENMRRTYEDNYYSNFNPGPKLIGRWSGRLESNFGSSAIALEFREDGRVIIHQQGRSAVQVTNTGLEYGMITGTALLALRPDTDEDPIECNLLLKVDEGIIYGCLMAHESYHSKAADQDFSIMHSGYLSFERTK
jgi:CubicO group peptidase (beta-lactamase class C family)